MAYICQLLNAKLNTTESTTDPFGPRYKHLSHYIIKLSDDLAYVHWQHLLWRVSLAADESADCIDNTLVWNTSGATLQADNS